MGCSARPPRTGGRCGATGGGTKVSILAVPLPLPAMDKNIVVPALLFFCVTYAFKLLIDARLRYLLLRAESAETVSALLAGEQRLRQAETLRGGLSMLGLAAGLALVAAFDWAPLSAATFAVLLAGVGLAQVASHWLLRRG